MKLKNLFITIIVFLLSGMVSQGAEHLKRSFEEHGFTR